MKKLLAVLIVLLFTVDSWAAIVTYNSLSGDAGVSYTHLNSSFQNLYNDYNGNINSDNLADGSITSDDIISNTNPLDRDFYNIGEYVYSGLTIATSATLASTITAGVSFVANDATNKLHLVVTGATAKTFTASKDTWVYLDYAGAFTYTEVANGAAQPATPSNSIVLAKVITSGTAITTVTDMRQTTPSNLRVYENYITGCAISRDITTATKISIDIGEVELGASYGKARKNTAPVYIDFTTNGEGGLDTGSLSEGFYYLFLVDETDNATNFAGIASSSSTDAASITGERLVGWCYAPSASAISPDSIGRYRGLGGDGLNMPFMKKDDLEDAYAANALVTLATLKVVSSGRPVLITYGMNATAGSAGNCEIILSIDSAAVPGAWMGFQTGTAGGEWNGLTAVYPTKLYPGMHTIDFKFRADSNQTIRNYKLIMEEK